MLICQNCPHPGDLSPKILLANEKAYWSSGSSHGEVGLRYHQLNLALHAVSFKNCASLLVSQAAGNFHAHQHTAKPQPSCCQVSRPAGRRATSKHLCCLPRHGPASSKFSWKWCSQCNPDCKMKVWNKVWTNGESSVSRQGIARVAEKCRLPDCATIRTGLKCFRHCYC